METKTLIPPAIFCPKCGNSIKLNEVNDETTVKRITEADYSQEARGVCGCGVYLVFLTKKMPLEPTFTILFNLYSTEKGGK